MGVASERQMRQVSTLLVVLVEAREEKVLAREGLAGGKSGEDGTGGGDSRGDEGGAGSSMADGIEEGWPRRRAVVVI